jgi:hypothetical protein
MDRKAVHDQWERDRATFHALLDAATADGLRQRSRGTRWTNQQLLFHMMFGYLIVRVLLVLIRGFGRLPPGVSRAFAQLLGAATVPFDAVNYAGACGGALIGPHRIGTWMDHIIAALHRSLDTVSEEELRRGMHFPTRWDPFFRDYMTLADLYHYPGQHFDFHRHQLTLDG